jgi:hypothetical protein
MDSAGGGYGDEVCGVESEFSIPAVGHEWAIKAATKV